MTSDVSTLAAKPRDSILTRRSLIIAAGLVLALCVAVVLYRQRSIEVLRRKSRTQECRRDKSTLICWMRDCS